MNDLLNLKGVFEQRSNASMFGKATLPVGKSVSVQQVEKILAQVYEISEFWKANTRIIKGGGGR